MKRKLTKQDPLSSLLVIYQLSARKKTPYIILLIVLLIILIIIIRFYCMRPMGQSLVLANPGKPKHSLGLNAIVI